MNEFLRFYSWGLTMKQSMALYTLALIFFKGVVNFLRGIHTVNSLTMLQMMVAAMLWAALESVLFPRNRELEGAALRNRTILWVVSGNLLLGGGALVFGWFAGIPFWAGLLLAVCLEGGIFSMWVGLRLALRKDTIALNRRLKSFQEEQ